MRVHMGARDRGTTLLQSSIKIGANLQLPPPQPRTLMRMYCMEVDGVGGKTNQLSTLINFHSRLTGALLHLPSDRLCHVGQQNFS